MKANTLFEWALFLTIIACFVHPPLTPLLGIAAAAIVIRAVIILMRR